MTARVLEKRRFGRIYRAPLVSDWDARPGHPVLMDVSGGGACLWLRDLPFRLNETACLRLQRKAGSLVLRAQLVWMRPCEPTSDGERAAPPTGWLAGLAFEPGQVAYSPNADLGEVEVDVLPENSPADAASYSIDEHSDAVSGESLLDGHAVIKLGAVAEDLLPVLSRHFADARLVLKRDRLEVSATFRSLEELNSLEAPRPRQRAVELQGPAHPISYERGPRAAPLPSTPGRAQGRSLALAASAIVLVLVGWSVLKLSPTAATGGPTARSAPVEERSIPAWARDLDAASLDGWIEVRTRFGLSDAAVGSVIRMVKTNDRYPPGHSFRDLSIYPSQVGRAFAILAAWKADRPFELDALKEELQGRLASGVRFPDEPPGHRYYSQLDARLYHNTVVMAIVELLHRRQQEADVKEIVAALRPSGA